MRLLVVEDDVPLREAICASAANWTLNVANRDAQSTRIATVVQAGSVAEGKALLRSAFEIVVVDVRLGQESGIALVEFARQALDMPAILAISGTATAAEAFQLASLGVRGYLAKPFDMRELRAAIQGLFEQPPDLAPGAMAQVGHRHIHVVQDEVKLAMLKRALRWERGNITHAARRLGVTRAAVQQMMDRYDVPRTAGDATDDD